MPALALTLPEIPAFNFELQAAVQAELDNKTKPPGSLGRLESMTARYVAIAGRRDLAPPRAEIVIMAADHGVANAGVSAYPQSVTEQMLRNFASGGAAINVFAKTVGATLNVINVGALGSTPPGVVEARVRHGSRNMLESEALSDEETSAAIGVGLDVARKLKLNGTNLVAIGEMGIANTTVAACLCAVFSGTDSALWVGRGTGIDDAVLVQKRRVVAQALQRHNPDPKQPLRVLAQVGGLELAALTGLILGAAAASIAVVIDGFITTAAALAAAAINPAVKHYLFASHLSTEPGHRLALNQLELEPVLDLQFRLGEGTGAALTLPFFSAGVRMLLEMATFESAGVNRRS